MATKQHPVTPKDQEAFDNGYKAGHLDRLMGIRLMGSFTGSYSLNRYTMYYGAGYRKAQTEQNG